MVPRARPMFGSSHLLAAGGLLLAFGLPAVTLIENHFRTDLSEAKAAAILAAIPWLVLAWVVLVEDQQLASIGLRWPTRSTLVFALAGVVVNVAISAVLGALNARLGLQEAQSDLMTCLLRGSGFLLVLLTTNGAVLTEIAFRGYAIECLESILGQRPWLAACTQITCTTVLLVVSRGVRHGLIWLADDLVLPHSNCGAMTYGSVSLPIACLTSPPPRW